MPPHPWLSAPPVRLPGDWWARCARAFETGSAALTPPQDVALWVFLPWLVNEHGVLLHGRQRPDVTRFEPRTPNDKSPDTFSKQTAVFASSDAVWALLCAVALGCPGRNMLNAALQDRVEGSRSPMRYFFSLSHGPALPFGPGVMDLLPRRGFVQMEPYPWPGVGEVLEPQWASSEAVTPLANVPVKPENFPLLDSVRRHDNDAVQARARTDLLAFPWLTAEG